MGHGLLLQAANYGYGSAMDPNTSLAMAGGRFLITLIFFLIALFFGLLHLYIYYHLITTDSKYFKDGVAEKKKWFWIIVLFPLTFIILIGFILVPGAFLYYIFVVKPDVDRRKKQIDTPQTLVNEAAFHEGVKI